MTSLGKRLLTAVVAIPLLIVVLICLPQANYLAFAIVCFAMSIIGSYEMRGMADKAHQEHIKFQPWLGVALPILTYIEKAFVPELNLTLFGLVCLLTLGFAHEALFGYHDNFKGSKARLETYTLEIIYPNVFTTFLIRMCFLENAWAWILLFLAFVFGSDSFAYIFGMLLGKNNKGIVKVSPNKSLAGFIAGILLPGVVGAIFTTCFSIYTISWYQGLILGLLTALAGTFGDLIESTFKRSANVKDSGTAIPGRGGVLDSIDSILIAAPIYLLCLYLFGV